jgi:APA family basic amino acid/polyamine antiporter
MTTRRRHRPERVLGVPALAAVAYGEIASSVWFALGIVAAFALALTPWVLLAVGALFTVVALAYAEGAAAMPEPGGAAAFVRRAFNDPAGFAVGWVIFLDYLIVIALAALFVPHYVGTAFEVPEATEGPWDAVAGVGVIAAVAAVRIVRRVRLYRVVIVLAGFSAATLAVLVALAAALLLSPGDITGGPFPSWSSLVFALALATLAYTGLETVANLAAEVRQPGRALPRSLFAGIAAAVAATTLVGVAWMAALPAGRVLGTEWERAPLVGVANALRGSVAEPLVDAFRIFIGIAGVLVLVTVISTSVSGAGRLARALAERQMLPRAFGRVSPRTLISPATILSAAGLAAGLLFIGAVHGQPARFLASLYSFGILIAFTGAQLAVLRLRVTRSTSPCGGGGCHSRLLSGSPSRAGCGWPPWPRIRGPGSPARSGSSSASRSTWSCAGGSAKASLRASSRRGEISCPGPKAPTGGFSCRSREAPSATRCSPRR